MNLTRSLSVFLMLGLILVLSPLGAKAGPDFGHHRRYQHHHGKSYGWHGPRRHAVERRHAYRHWRRSHFPHRYVRYGGPPSVVYVRPVAPLVGIQPCPAPQPYYPQPAPPGFSGQFTFSF